MCGTHAKAINKDYCLKKRSKYYRFNPILDGGGGKQICPPPAGFLNIAQKPLGLGS